MGIAVQELLANDFFREFEVIAGRKGIYKEIQGLTILDAPDGFKWTKGKEMIMSSGYAIMNEPDCISRAFAEGSIQKASAFMLKQGRYLERIPDDLVVLCNEYELPLIVAPFWATWMEIASQTNVAVMNRTIRKFQVHDPGNSQITNQSCFAAIGAMNSEMKSRGWLWGAIGLQLGTGYTIAFLVNQFGTLFTEGHFAEGFVPGLIAVLCMVAALILIGRKVRSHFDEQYELHKASKAVKAIA